MKAAIYARVSTKDKGQDVENQLAQLRRYAKERAWDLVEYVDHESGKASAGRAQLQAMFAAASRREFNVVLIWALDRLSREGVSKTFEHIKMLRGYGVEIESYTEPYFRTTGPVGELVIAIFAWIAEQERIRISERTKAGLATARAKGKTLGRPWSVIPRGRIYEDRKRGLSWSALEEIWNLPVVDPERGQTRGDIRTRAKANKTAPATIPFQAWPQVHQNENALEAYLRLRYAVDCCRKLASFGVFPQLSRSGRRARRAGKRTKGQGVRGGRKLQRGGTTRSSQGTVLRSSAHQGTGPCQFQTQPGLRQRSR